jgi:hypothetical protein
MAAPTPLDGTTGDPWRQRQWHAQDRPQRRAAVDAATAWQVAAAPKRRKTEPAAESPPAPDECINDLAYRELVSITASFAKDLTARVASERYWAYVHQIEKLFLHQGTEYIARMFAQPDLAALSLKQLEIVRVARAEHDPTGLSGSDGRTHTFNTRIATLFPESIADHDHGAAVRELKELAARYAVLEKRTGKSFGAPR